MARDEAYPIAEERIEAALKKGSTGLDLSSLGLTEIPGSIAQFTHLTEERLLTKLKHLHYLLLNTIKGKDYPFIFNKSN